MSLDLIRAQLSSYDWSYYYQTETSTGNCFVKFDPQGSIAYHTTGGNAQGSQYTISDDGKHITTSIGRSTKMYPPPDVRERESWISAVFNFREELPFDLVIADNKETASLTVPLRDDTKKVTFDGQLSDEGRYGPPTTTFYDIHPDSGQYVIRSVKYDDQFIKSTVSDWSEYKNDIQGVELDPNLKIRVRCREYSKDGQTKRVQDIIVASELIEKP